MRERAFQIIYRRREPNLKPQAMRTALHLPQKATLEMEERENLTKEIRSRLELKQLKLKQLFSKIDIDGDKVISKEEFKSGLQTIIQLNVSLTESEEIVKNGMRFGEFVKFMQTPKHEIMYNNENENVDFTNVMAHPRVPPSPFRVKKQIYRTPMKGLSSPKNRLELMREEYHLREEERIIKQRKELKLQEEERNRNDSINYFQKVVLDQVRKVSRANIRARESARAAKKEMEIEIKEEVKIEDLEEIKVEIVDVVAKHDRCCVIV